MILALARVIKTQKIRFNTYEQYSDMSTKFEQDFIKIWSTWPTECRRSWKSLAKLARQFGHAMEI